MTMREKAWGDRVDFQPLSLPPYWFEIQGEGPEVSTAIVWRLAYG